MADAKYTLHYGGKEFPLADNDVFGEMSPWEGGTIQLRLADDRWLTIVVGPGVPIAIEERKPEGTIIY